MPDVQTREEIDAKIAASEARNDTKIARLEGKIDLLLEKATQAAAAAREEGRSTRANIVVLGTALALLIVAIVTLFPVFFDLGENIKGMVEQAVATRH